MNTNDSTVILKTRNVYGNDLVYPVNVLAQQLARLIGAKTFNTANLQIIRDMGFKVEFAS
jgi:hypothetical protein